MRRFWNLVIGSWCLFGIWDFGFGISKVVAIYDPLSVPNNRIGVHILDPGEISQAAKLVNSTGGYWGYVTIPMRSNDRDREKWTDFFLQTKNLHLIPIIRLATYPDGGTWVRPTVYDLVDFANFLNDMPWPTQNRYVTFFNEPNHGSEWGGEVNPSQYATLLIDAKDIFKSRSADFFLLSAGLDMSAPTNHTSLDALEFYRRMTKSQPNWYKSIDGLSVHAYPNPGFSASVYSKDRYGITSYRYEQKYLKINLPLFITETGSLNSSENFYTTAFNQVWTEPNIVAITPFLLFATGQFQPFSLLDTSHQPTAHYAQIQHLPKIAGSPHLSTQTLKPSEPGLPSQPSKSTNSPDFVRRLLNLLSPASPQLTLGQTTISVEIADTPQTRAQGLSGRKALPENTGMLFMFPQVGLPTFWMKDMVFALDFIWINKGQIVQIHKNIPPPSDPTDPPQVITPDYASLWVLEVPAGFIDNHNISVGDTVVLN